MAQNIDLKIKGLYTHPNPFSEIPSGALLQAHNVVIDRESIASTRRGNRLDDVPIDPTNTVDSATVYQDELVYRDDTDALLHKIPDGAITTYTSPISPPPGVRMRYKESNRKLFLTSDNGVQQVVGVGSADHMASGMPRGLDMTFVLGAGTVIPDSTAVAYRVVWGTKDQFEFLILGAPSERLIVINTLGSDQDATITITIPDNITVNDFYQVYRSAPSATASTIPNDELQLVFEANPSVGDITAGTVTMTDIVPEELKRATIYTAPSQEGISQANSNPPMCEDMELFKNHMFFSNTRLRHSAIITLLGVGAPSALQDGDTITIDSIVYTYKTAPVAATDIQLFTAGTPSQDIDDTARETVKVVNANPASTVNAYYLSGFNDLPGEMQFELQDFNLTAFVVSSSRDVFDPPAVFNGGETSNNDSKANRVYFSKPQQPEAVPLGSFFDIGSEEDPIQRIIALRESLYVLKDDGMFRIVGTDADTFRVILADSTTTLIGPETAVVHNNQLTFYSDQGVVSVSENADVAILSRPIEKDLFEISALAGFAENSFSVAYESDRKLILWTINPETGLVSLGFIYNSITKSWTTWTFKDIHENSTNFPYHNVEMKVQLVNPDDDKLYSFIDDTTDNELWIERKTFTLDDHHDGELAVTVDNVIDSFNIELDTTYAGKEGFVGASLKQTNKTLRIVAVSDGITGTILTFDVAVVWTLVDPAFILTPIDVSLEWTPISVQNPGMIKWWRDISFVFEESSFSNMSIVMSTDFGGGDSVHELVPDVTGLGWGNQPWGTSPWGGALDEVGRQVIRTMPPRDASRGHWISIVLGSKQADQKFGLAGISLMYDNVSSKFKGTTR